MLKDLMSLLPLLIARGFPLSFIYFFSIFVNLNQPIINIKGNMDYFVSMRTLAFSWINNGLRLERRRTGHLKSLIDCA